MGCHLLTYVWPRYAADSGKLRSFESIMVQSSFSPTTLFSMIPTLKPTLDTTGPVADWFHCTSGKKSMRVRRTKRPQIHTFNRQVPFSMASQANALHPGVLKQTSQQSPSLHHIGEIASKLTLVIMVITRIFTYVWSVNEAKWGCKISESLLYVQDCWLDEAMQNTASNANFIRTAI